MQKAYQYRLYPTKAQVRTLASTFDTCRKLYNDMLALRKESWETEKKSVSYYEEKRLLPEWKTLAPELKTVHSQVLQDVVARVDLAYQHFFRRVKAGETAGYPRFKGYGRYRSITYPQYGNGCSLTGSVLHLSKIGGVPVKLHRAIEGEIKVVTIRRAPTGKWYVSFSVECEPSITISEKPSVGVDVGIHTFAALSNGDMIENPRFFRSEEKELAKVQRRMSRSPKGSPSWYWHLKSVQRAHERIANKRKNFVHQTSRYMVNRFGTLYFEDLNIVGMMHNHCLAKSIADVAWGMLVQFTQNKAANAGSSVVLVDPRNTSQKCSRCGMVVQKDLSVRVHECPYCGLSIDRDINAALNILGLGLQSSTPKGVQMPAT